MKRFSFIVLFVALFAGCGQDTILESTTSSGVVEGLDLKYFDTNFENTFEAIFFVDENTGYIAGNNGMVCKTTNGGKSWIKLPTGITLPLYGIYFLSKEEGFAVGGESSCGGTGCVPAGPVIIYTKDGGQTWEKTSIPVTDKIELKSICFATGSIGFSVGGNTILSTNDKGKNWRETKINDVGGTMLDVEFLNDKQGMISCVAGKIIKTVDGGLNWSISSPFPSVGGYSLSLVNDHLVFSAGYTSINKSTDFGNSWSALSLYPDDIFKLVFKTSQIGYAFGRGQYSGGDFGHNYGAIYYTTDGGLTWKGNDRLKEIGLIKSASFPSENVGYAISDNIVIKIVKQ